MQKLVAGIHHFQANIFANHRETWQRLADGQHPETLFVTCSDSRILPSLITNCQPGEMFVLRNAGNIVPPYGAANGGEGATIEFAIAALGIKDLVVCGHSHCGAMKGLLEPDSLRDLPLMNNWLKHAEATRWIMKEKYPHLSGNALLTATVEENVLVQLENLRTHPAVAAHLSRGTLKLHGWVYKIETGEIFAYDPERGQFLPLTDGPPLPVAVPAQTVDNRTL
jgi:carbonic anhydrase